MLISNEFYFNNKKYIIEFQEISIKQAAIIDYLSYSEEIYSSILEWKNIFNNIPFTLIEDDKIIFNSVTDNYNQIDFYFAIKICEILGQYLNLNKTIAQEYEKQCAEFLKDSDHKNKIPYELLIASQLNQNNLTITLKEFEELNIITYEKILLSLKQLKAVEQQKG
jgi:hypothetical protein